MCWLCSPHFCFCNLLHVLIHQSKQQEWSPQHSVRDVSRVRSSSARWPSNPRPIEWPASKSKWEYRLNRWNEQLLNPIRIEFWGCSIPELFHASIKAQLFDRRVQTQRFHDHTWSNQFLGWFRMIWLKALAQGPWATWNMTWFPLLLEVLVTIISKEVFEPGVFAPWTTKNLKA